MPRPVVLFEVDLAALVDVLYQGLTADAAFPPMTAEAVVLKRPSQFVPLPRYPGAYRDLAVVLDRDVPADLVRRIIERHPLVAQATLFDVYEGSGVASREALPCLSSAPPALRQDPDGRRGGPGAGGDTVQPGARGRGTAPQLGRLQAPTPCRNTYHSW